MVSVVLTNKPNKREIINRFMRSRGLDNFIIFTEAAEIGELLNDMMTTSQETFNLHIFDYYGDLSLTNAIRDYRDQINMLRVFVTSAEDAMPYLTITDDVYVMPNDYNILMYFWDSDACKAKNVTAFNLMKMDYFKIDIPRTLGKTDQLSIDITTRKIPLKYKTASGSVVETQGPQIVVDCHAKVKEVRSIFNTRKQDEVYNHKTRDLEDLPASLVEPLPEEQVASSKPEKDKLEKPVKVKPQKTEPVFHQKQEKAGSDKRLSGVTSFFSKLKPRDPEVSENHEDLEQVELPKLLEESDSEASAIQTEEPIVTEAANVAQVSKQEASTSINADEPKHEQRAYIGFSNVKSGTQVSSSKAVMHRYSLADVYDSISQYCIQKKYISAEDGAALIKELVNKPSKDALFGNIALERGLISEMQLIEAITQVNHTEILTWDAVDKMELDFTFFSREKCMEYKFFKLKDYNTMDNVTIVCASSISSIHPEVRRLFDSPRILYTLDAYIERKLQGGSE